MIPLLSSFLAGLLFAIGLAVGGMTQPARVVGFLDVSGGAWDPSLGFVMAGAVASYGVALFFARRRERPVLAARFLLPTRQDLPPRLFVGAGLFGVGWAIAGFCPGPALAGAGAGVPQAWVFLPAMAAGMLLLQAWERRAVSRPSAPREEPRSGGRTPRTPQPGPPAPASTPATSTA